VENAVSVDGRTFSCLVPSGTPWVCGDLLVLATPAGDRLAQVMSTVLQPDGDHVLVAGSVLTAVDDAGRPTVAPATPFSASPARPAPPALALELQRSRGGDLAVGALRTGAGDGPEVPALLRSAAFNRHTFLCGQSGSGKTYALGVLLERLLAGTGLPMLVLDPNGDFRGLGTPRPGTADADSAALARAGVTVLSAGDADRGFPGPPGAPPAAPLLVAFRELSTAAKAAVLQIDPLTDREEYNALLNLLRSEADQHEIQALTERLAHADTPVSRAVSQRLQNLGLLEWSAWSRGRRTVLEERHETTSRALVLDLAGAETPEERSLLALAVLDDLWARREAREPVLVVIDEAHNLCPAQPQDELQAATTSRLRQIAAEGRKYGLWLLLSTQQPSKVHPGVLSQCDNLLLMRMNSPADLAELGAVMGFAPPEMLAASTSFRQGEVLAAGTFAAAPLFVRMGTRYTVEGGSDVAVPSLPA
jgi:DNA helicase HerA-like ATPase